MANIADLGRIEVTPPSEVRKDFNRYMDTYNAAYDRLVRGLNDAIEGLTTINPAFLLQTGESGIDLFLRVSKNNDAELKPVILEATELPYRSHTEIMMNNRQLLDLYCSLIAMRGNVPDGNNSIQQYNKPEVTIKYTLKIKKSSNPAVDKIVPVEEIHILYHDQHGFPVPAIGESLELDSSYNDPDYRNKIDVLNNKLGQYQSTKVAELIPIGELRLSLMDVMLTYFQAELDRSLKQTESGTARVIDLQQGKLDLG